MSGTLHNRIYMAHSIKNKKPNIILINCDDLGWGDLSCYGSTMNKTPYLDRMADEGIRFTNFYMSSSVYSPGRGAMMTGCYAPRIGFDSFNGTLVLFPGMDCGLNPEETTNLYDKNPEIVEKLEELADKMREDIIALYDLPDGG